MSSARRLYSSDLFSKYRSNDFLTFIRRMDRPSVETNLPSKKRKRVRQQLKLQVNLCCYPLQHNKAPPTEHTSSLQLSSYYDFCPGDKIFYRPRVSDKGTLSFYGIYKQQESTTHSLVQLTETPFPDETSHCDNNFLAHKSVETCRLVPYYCLPPPEQQSSHNHPDSEKTTTIALVVTPDTERFRHLAESQQLGQVLEIGCSTGRTSVKLVERATSWVGFDTSAEMIQTVQKDIPNTPSTTTNPDDDQCRTWSGRIDALADSLQAQEKACQFGGPDTVFLDIGGNREELAVLRMLEFIVTRLPSVRHMFVKSEALFHSLEKDQQKQVTTGESRGFQRQFWVQDAVSWISQRQQPLLAQQSTPAASSAHFSFPRHPLKAPLRLSPKDSSTPICRYHNYHKKGCRRWIQQQQQEAQNIGVKEEQDSRIFCDLDHDHCHWCLLEGHIALNCPQKDPFSLGAV